LQPNGDGGNWKNLRLGFTSVPSSWRFVLRCGRKNSERIHGKVLARFKKGTPAFLFSLKSSWKNSDKGVKQHHFFSLAGSFLFSGLESLRCEDSNLIPKTTANGSQAVCTFQKACLDARAIACPGVLF
jgi:hypothetical protein